ncbi:MAG: HAD family hydrolase [Desulfurococcaceae archaeon]
MSLRIDNLEESKPCIIGFDIWGTLLDLNRVLEAIAINMAKRLNLNESHAVKKMLEVHEAAKKIRRINPDISSDVLLETSKKLLTESFNIPLHEVDEIINAAFHGVGKNVIYEDALQALKTLWNMNIRMGAVGNVLFWPSKYTRILLNELNISEYFKVTLFSDEVNAFKPDRKVFLRFVELMNSEPQYLIYVGDNIIEDAGGALSAGGFGVLISRRSNKKIIVPELRVALITNLTELIDVYKTVCLVKQ